MENLDNGTTYHLVKRRSFVKGILATGAALFLPFAAPSAETKGFPVPAFEVDLDKAEEIQASPLVVETVNPNSSILVPKDGDFQIAMIRQLLLNKGYTLEAHNALGTTFGFRHISAGRYVSLSYMRGNYDQILYTIDKLRHMREVTPEELKKARLNAVGPKYYNQFYGLNKSDDSRFEMIDYTLPSNSRLNTERQFALVQSHSAYVNTTPFPGLKGDMEKKSAAKTVADRMKSLGEDKDEALQRQDMAQTLSGALGGAEYKSSGRILREGE